MSHHRNPRALLTPAMRQVLERMARAGRPPLHALTPDHARGPTQAGRGHPRVRRDGFPGNP